MNEQDRSVRRYNVAIQKDKSQKPAASSLLGGKLTSRDITLSREDCRSKAKENSQSRQCAVQPGRSPWQVPPKEHGKHLSKPGVSRNSSSSGQYAKSHTRLHSEVTTASTTLRKTQQEGFANCAEEVRPVKTVEGARSQGQLEGLYCRVQSILEQCRLKERQWNHQKSNYERKIALLVNQLVKTERLR